MEWARIVAERKMQREENLSWNINEIRFVKRAFRRSSPWKIYGGPLPFPENKIGGVHT